MLISESEELLDPIGILVYFGRELEAASPWVMGSVNNDEKEAWVEGRLRGCIFLAASEVCWGSWWSSVKESCLLQLLRRSSTRRETVTFVNAQTKLESEFESEGLSQQPWNRSTLLCQDLKARYTMPTAFIVHQLAGIQGKEIGVQMKVCTKIEETHHITKNTTWSYVILRCQFAEESNKKE